MEQTPLPQPLRQLLGASLDRVLALDPAAAANLAKLEGKVMQLNLDGPNWVVWFQIAGGRVLVLESFDGRADTSVTGTPIALFSMALPQAAAGAGKVRIEGDAETAQQLNRLLRQLDPDWDEALAKTFGDVFGHQLGRALRGGFALARRVATTMSQNLSEYLREESRLLVTQTEMDEFVEQVDDLRDDVERLEARVARREPQS